MNQLPPFIIFLLAALVLTAGVYDIRSRRIPNWLTLSGFLVGLGLNFFLYGPRGLLFACEGFGLAFLVYFPFYLLRGMGAGDVKLMAAIGALIGPWNWLLVFIVTGLLGGLLALLMAFSHGLLLQTILNLFYIAKELVCLRAPYRTRHDLDVRNPAALRLPHGAVIAIGTLGVVALGKVFRLF